MAVNGMAVGKDYTFGYYDADSKSIISLGDVQNVSIKALKKDITSEPYNDVPRFGYIPGGYEISGTITRVGPELEDFQLAANTRFNSGQHTRAGFLNEKIYNPDGSYSSYQYTGFVFWLGDIGDISRDKPVMMKFEGKASDKLRVA